MDHQKKFAISFAKILFQDGSLIIFFSIFFIICNLIIPTI